MLRELRAEEEGLFPLYVLVHLGPRIQCFFPSVLQPVKTIRRQFVCLRLSTHAVSATLSCADTNLQTTDIASPPPPRYTQVQTLLRLQEERERQRKEE